MANIFAGVFNAVVAPKALQAFKVGLLPITAFSTDFSEIAIQRKGNAIDIPLFDAMTADTDENDYEDETGATTTKVTVTLGTYAKRTIHLLDKDAGQNQIDLWTGMMEEAAYAVARLVVETILGEVTLANFGAAAFTGAAATFDTDDLYTIRTTMNQDGMPMRNRSVVLTSPYSEGLLTDTSLKNADASGSDAALREANPGRIAGMEIIESDVVPTNGENLVGFTAHRSAIGVAMRPFMPQEGFQDAGVMWRVMTDPVTRISLSMRSHYSPKQGKRFVTFDTWYGFKVAQPKGIKRIVSA